MQTFEHTQNYGLYKEYIKAREENPFMYKGIDIMQACYVELFEIMAEKRTFNAREIGGQLFKYLDTDNLCKGIGKSDIILTFDMLKRKDHLALAKSVSSSISGCSLILLKYKYTPLFNPVRFFSNLKWAKKNLNTSITNSIYIAARILFYQRIIDGLEKNKPTKKLRYIPFSSTAYTENVLAQFLKKNGATTYHLFHGFFGRYKKKIANDIIAGDNIRTDIIMAFSEGQKQDLVNYFGIDPKKIKICGHPKYPEKTIETSGKLKDCLVLGGIGLYDNGFLQLLNILNNTANKELTFYVKPHPLSKIQKSTHSKTFQNIRFIDQSSTVQELLNSKKFDFAITYNTSTYYECMYYGVIPLRWALDENLDFEGLDDRFDSEETLLEKIEQYNCADKNETNNKMSFILKNILGMGINNFNEILHDTQDNR